MNMSKVISSLIMKFGLYSITLPFKDQVTGKPIPTENVIMDVIKTVTIPEYSEFVPWIREYDTSISSLKKLDKNKSIYLLPPFLTITPIKSVISVTLPNQNNRGTYGDIAPAYGINRSVQGVITSQSYMMLAGQMRSEPTWEYLGENKIQLYGFPKVVVTFKVAAEHDESGETIESTCYDSFMSLASLDLKMFLYNTLRHYDGIPSAFGNINLKIDDYNNAESDREALLNEWRDKFHLDMSLEQFM